MGFLDNLGSSFKDLLSPSRASTLFREGAGEVFRPLKRLLSPSMPNSITQAGSNAADFGLNTVLGLPFIYEAVKPDKPELDQSGPMEDTARRAFNLSLAGAGMAPSFWHGRGVIAPLLGLMGATNVGEIGSKYLGRGADAALGLRPTPDELMQRFTSRIDPRTEEISSQYQVPREVAQQHAVKELLAEDPSYLDWANQ